MQAWAGAVVVASWLLGIYLACMLQMATVVVQTDPPGVVVLRVDAFVALGRLACNSRGIF